MTTWQPITQNSELPQPHDSVEESEFLDFKAEGWKGGEDGAREIARDVAQFANHLGGSIIVGAVEDDHNRLMAYQPVPDAASVAQRVTDVCHTWLFPRLEIHPTLMVTTDRKDAVLVVNVEPFGGVVAITPRGKDYSEFYRRFGKGKKPISFEEVERMWTDGRKGRLLLAKIPKIDLGKVRLDVVEGHGIALSKHLELLRLDDYFNVSFGAGAPSFNFPYEFVRAVWPAAGGGWHLSLSVKFELNSLGEIRTYYVSR